MAETYTTPTKESKNELTNNSNNKNSPNRYIVDIIDKANSTRRIVEFFEKTVFVK
ncbi:hypothetical protein C1646_763966 [Rhizophagus diaphanus]|nr:hypothetical protein C1646_763966 [Rhizophagus diaphanus] [Rhizophagus sp. MUCL 43196]